jgi:hypothetical protein
MASSTAYWGRNTVAGIGHPPNLPVIPAAAAFSDIILLTLSKFQASSSEISNPNTVG